MTKSMAETTIRIFLRSSVLKSVESKKKTKAAAINPQNSFDFLLENILMSDPHISFRFKRLNIFGQNPQSKNHFFLPRPKDRPLNPPELHWAPAFQGLPALARSHPHNLYQTTCLRKFPPSSSWTGDSPRTKPVCLLFLLDSAVLA